MERMELVQKHLPLSLDLLPSKFREARLDPEQFIPLAISYEAMQREAAWADFLSRLEIMRAQMENALMTGALDDRGQDMAKCMRANLGLLVNIMAIPGAVAIDRKMMEEGMGVMGAP